MVCVATDVLTMSPIILSRFYKRKVSEVKNDVGCRIFRDFYVFYDSRRAILVQFPSFADTFEQCPLEFTKPRPPGGFRKRFDPNMQVGGQSLPGLSRMTQKSPAFGVVTLARFSRTFQIFNNTNRTNQVLTVEFCHNFVCRRENRIHEGLITLIDARVEQWVDEPWERTVKRVKKTVVQLRLNCYTQSISESGEFVHLERSGRIFDVSLLKIMKLLLKCPLDVRFIDMQWDMRCPFFIFHEQSI